MSETPNQEIPILNAALELPPEERAAYLDRACAGDDALRKEVETLLEHAQAEGFLEAAPPGVDYKRTLLVNAPVLEKPGDRIGRYKLLQQIGEGGCGVVYMAEQEEPVRRRVAIKVIKLGMDTKQVIARFEAERQALALMDHANIARVFDAGTTETGRPYFVMELVRGIKITDYCDENNVSTEERLKLFNQVCQAIQHAHQKGIIHRDIKPSNILVTVNDDVPVPKVIDFGIAKATQGRLTDQTLFTAFEQFMGTPAYMSPEQAVMTSLDIDTRTDIYSLGVLLYELLTGKTPFDQKELLAAGLDEMRRTIREVEPVKPSTRLTQAAKSEARSPKSEKSALRTPHSAFPADLDWIVMKCLEKDRTRRYETASGLASDISRHLHNEPVVARPPSAVYRFQKAIRRNKLAFAAASAVVVTLALGVAASTLQAVRATRAERAQFRLREQAENARNGEAVQRKRAEQSELIARQNLYVADLNLVQRDLDRGNLGAARTLLAAHQPLERQEDLRGFEWRYLWGAARGDHFAALRGHSNVVTSLAISPDGKLILSGSQDQTVRLWDLASHAALATLPTFSSLVYSVAFSPDGKVFAVGSGAGVTLWNTERRELLCAAGRDAARVAFSPAGNLLAFGTSKTWSDRTGLSVTLFDYSTGKEVATFPEGGSRAMFSPDGKMLALAGRSDAVKLVDIATLKEVGVLPHADTVISLAFTPDGAKLLVAYWGGETRVWDVATQQPQTSLNGHTARVWCMAFSPDNHTLATASSDQTVRLWNVSTWQPKEVLRGHANEVWGVAFTPDGETLVTSSKDETLMLTHLRSARAASEIVLNKERPLISPSGLLLATASQPGRTVLWNLATTRQVAEFDGSPVGFSDKGRTLVTHGLDASLLFWNVADRSVRSRTVIADQQSIDWSVLSPDGRIWVAKGGDGSLRFFNAASGKALGVVLNHTQGPGALAFSPDSKLVATVQSGRLNLWDSASLHQVATEFKHKMLIEHCAFSPDGKLLATGGADGMIIVREAPTLNELARLTGHRQGVASVVFSPDGKTLVSSSDDENVKFWNVPTFREMITLVYKNDVDCLFFSQDGGMLALESFGGPLKILRPPSFAEIAAAESSAAEKP